MTDFLLIGNYFGIVISIIFFIIFCFTNSKLNKARSFVMIGMLLFAIGFLFDTFIILEEKYSAIFVAIVYLPLLFILYPLVFHYILNLISNSEKVIIEKEKFILPLFVLLINLVTYLYFGEVGIKKFKINEYLVFSSDLKTYDFVLIFLIILYYLQAIYFIYRLFNFHKSLEIRNAKTNSQAYLQRWVKYITFGVIFVEFTYILILFFSIEVTNIDIATSILFVVFFGIVGIKHNEILLSMKITNGFKKHKIEDLSKRKRESKLSSGKLQSIIIQMDRLISVEKLYLDPNLKLKNFAKKIHIPEKELSILINDQFNKNFTTYINNFRIDEAKNILEKRSGNFKLENLYLEVGFFTRSTFNRVFKSTTNTTPSEYRKSISF